MQPFIGCSLTRPRSLVLILAEHPSKCWVLSQCASRNAEFYHNVLILSQCANSITMCFPECWVLSQCASWGCLFHVLVSSGQHLQKPGCCPGCQCRQGGEACRGGQSRCVFVRCMFIFVCGCKMGLTSGLDRPHSTKHMLVMCAEKLSCWGVGIDARERRVGTTACRELPYHGTLWDTLLLHALITSCHLLLV